MRTKTGPKSFVPAEPILGGQLVEARAAGRVGVAAADSLKVLGVAVVDGIAPEGQVTTAVDVGGRPVLNAAVLPAIVSVAYSGIEVPVVYAGAAAFGDRLKAAAGGRVVTAGATPDARLVVGICTEPAGVASGATGLMRTL